MRDNCHLLAGTVLPEGAVVPPFTVVSVSSLSRNDALLLREMVFGSVHVASQGGGLVQKSQSGLGDRRVNKSDSISHINWSRKIFSSRKSRRFRSCGGCSPTWVCVLAPKHAFSWTTRDVDCCCSSARNACFLAVLSSTPKQWLDAASDTRTRKHASKALNPRAERFRLATLPPTLLPAPQVSCLVHAHKLKASIPKTKC